MATRNPGSRTVGTTYVEMYYNRYAQDLQDIQVGSTVALQNPRTKLWDIYGAVVNISPHRRYSHAGRVLVRNRLFLRFRSSASTITHDGGSPPRPSQQRESTKPYPSTKQFTRSTNTALADPPTTSASKIRTHQ